MTKILASTGTKVKVTKKFAAQLVATPMAAAVGLSVLVNISFTINQGIDPAPVAKSIIYKVTRNIATLGNILPAELPYKIKYKHN